MKRREFQQRVITVGAASAVEAARSTTFIPSPTSDPFKDPDYIRNLATRLATGQRENGGISVLSTASRHFQKIRSLLTGKDIKLQQAASYLARQIAWTLQDAHRYEAAEKAAATAFQLAHRSGDIEAQACALSCLSNNDVERRRTTGAKYAHAGLRLHELDPSDHAILTIRLGRSLALVGGQERDARQHIDQALGIDGLSSFDASEIMDHAGRGLLDLGLYAVAYDSLGRAAELREPWTALQADCLAGQVMAALGAHQRTPRGVWLEMAADRMFALAHVVPLVSSARVDHQVTDILEASAQWGGVPVMHAARDQLREVAPRNG